MNIFPSRLERRFARHFGRVACACFAASLHLRATDFSLLQTNQDWGNPETMDRQQVIDRTMHPYEGPAHHGVDTTTLSNKVMCGYRGWFAAPGDGSGRGWGHWANHGEFRPGRAKVDLWPDVSELDNDERFNTSFTNADGLTAQVFSSFTRKTVLRHFKWMQDYGIDGVFVQRFVTELGAPRNLRHVNVVLDHCREGANLFGRTYAVMYDLSGLGAGQMQRIKDDWMLLIDQMQITRDPAYLHHHGKPVVTLWGFGFNDHRRYTPEEGIDLVRFLEEDPRYGHCTVMLGVPTYWRTLDRDCVTNTTMHELILKADIVSPWTVGRYGNLADAANYATRTMKPDLDWCGAHGKEFMPVVFPGFSWHNMYTNSPQNQIPRRKGEFLWNQFVRDRKAGATMFYQAMFDEVDEGTAIFKCAEHPPVSETHFIDYEGLPSDYYLKLVGHAAQLLRANQEFSADGFRSR